VPFFRRRKPLHEQLAEGTDLLRWEHRHEPLGPFQGTLDVLHGGRPRRWDAVVTAAAPALTGEIVHFVALDDGTLVVEESVATGALDPVVDAVEQELKPPYRAEAVRRGDVWAAAANAIEVVEVPEDVAGDRLELSVRHGDRELVVDGQPSLWPLPTLEAYGKERHHDYVLRAERIDGALWEVQVNPL
jgi:hypothetical protein